MPKKQLFEKYCSCQKAYQSSALCSIFQEIYLEKLAIGDKYINKRIQLSIHQTVSKNQHVKEKNYEELFTSQNHVIII